MKGYQTIGTEGSTPMLWHYTPLNHFQYAIFGLSANSDMISFEECNPFADTSLYSFYTIK
jgi:hypothetical protein